MGKMTLLLDTHIFLWWLFDDSRLPAGIRRAVEEADNAVLISAASVWEITTKFRLINGPRLVAGGGEGGDEAEGGEHEENLSAFSSKRPSFKRIKEEKADRQKFVTSP